MDRKKTLLVIGLGRIGLPQALVLADQGFQVYGYARNVDMLEGLAEHKAPFVEADLQELLRKHYGKNFIPFTSWDKTREILPKIEGIFFSIGTKTVSNQDITQNSSLDLSGYYALFDQIFSDKRCLKKPITLIIRTTVPLGTTDQFKQYLEKKYAFKESQDFFLGFVPERMAEGAAIKELQSLPRIIGTYSDEGFAAIQALVTQSGGDVIRVANPLTAEFCKLTDNSYRSTLFGYANELAMYANTLKISISEVIDAVNQHYQRNHLPQPGFVSGYCLSKDPYIFELDFLKNHPHRDFHSVWYYARRTNDFLMQFVVQKITDFVGDRKNVCVAILGLSFKADVDDFRLSHGFTILDQLIAAQITQFKLYDPNFNKNSYTRLPDQYLPFVGQASATLNQKMLAAVDAIIVLSPHRALKRRNDSAKLTKLLKGTQNPCYLLDLYRVWDEASSIEHIQYATFEEGV